MPRKSTKSDASSPELAATATPSSTSSPATSRKTANANSNTPAKDSKAASTSTAIASTPASATKSARRPSSSKAKSGTMGDKKAAGNTLAGSLGKSYGNNTNFLIAEILCLGLMAVGHSLVGEMSRHELGTLRAGRHNTEGVVGQALWRIAFLAISWFAKLDSLDVASLAFLAHAPTAYLLSTFYYIRPSTAISSVLVDVVASAVPFYLLRPLANVHKPSVKVHNRELISGVTRLYIIAFSTAVYTVTTVLSLRLTMPRFFVLYFKGIGTVEPAYNAQYGTLLVLMALFGAATVAFVFPSFVSTTKAKEDDRVRQFNPEDATLTQTFLWNVWGYTVKTKVLIRRTAISIFVTAVGTYLSLTLTIEGVEATGAAAYSTVWAASALVSAVGIGLIGQD